LPDKNIPSFRQIESTFENLFFDQFQYFGPIRFEVGSARAADSILNYHHQHKLFGYFGNILTTRLCGKNSYRDLDIVVATKI